MSDGMNDCAEPTAKVLFRVPHEDSAAKVETLWAYDLGANRYKINNLPFFVCGISTDDIVHAPFCTAEGFATFERVVSKSGNRTIWITLDLPMEAGNVSADLLNTLVVMGCSFEGFNKSYVALNIPPLVSLMEVQDILARSGTRWASADT